MVLELIDEFVFFTKPSLSKSKRLNSIQELQLMQNLIDFFQEHSPTNIPTNPTYGSPSLELFEAYNSSPDMLILCNIFNYLFMEPSHKHATASSKVGVSGDDSYSNLGVKTSDRMRSLAKLASMALGLKNRSVLHCLGVWLQRQGDVLFLVVVVVGSLGESWKK